MLVMSVQYVHLILPKGEGIGTDGQMSLITPATAYPICTIANTPRLPEHCIEWASVLEWPKVFKGPSIISSHSSILHGKTANRQTRN
jgi:hypothetical protein